MGELGISLFLSEYPGFSDETEESEFLFEVHQPPNKSVQPNAGICHAACFRRHLEMKPKNRNRHAARGAPAPVVADL